MVSSVLDQAQRAEAEALISARVHAWASAIVAKDIERVMSLYSADLVSFDLDPPLRYAGTSNKRRAWEQLFSLFPATVSYEVTELSITAGADTAFVHSLNHVAGRRTSGQVSELWLRWTACFRRTGDAWFVTHDHASVPAELTQGRAALDLAP
ncbi:MAG TPA: nuclear transport factor 2 family protein [Polyangiaceae bacterium]|nr:nuclear transport factor 2 family protein [Polyangiaceae bacterium]